MSATAEHEASGTPSRLVGHCYTKARRFPLVIGKLPGGGRIPGGPYSLHQIGAMVVSAVVLKQTSPLWAHFGPLNLVIFVAVPYGIAFALRHARVDGRSPIWAATGWLSYMSAPKAGRLRGRPIRPVRTHRQAGRFRFGPVPPSPSTAGSSIAAPRSRTMTPPRPPRPRRHTPVAQERRPAAVRRPIAPELAPTRLEQLIALSARRSEPGAYPSATPIRVQRRSE